MQLTVRKAQGILLLTLLGSAASAMAQTGFYGGAGIGLAKTSVSTESLTITGATATTLTKDESDEGDKIYGGYRAHQNWAVEVGYVDFGKSRATRSMTAPGTGSIAIDASNSGWFADVVGFLPLGGNDFSLIGRLGLIASETRNHLTTTGAVTLAPGIASSSTEKETNWKYGAGAHYEINKTVAARGEVEVYRKLGTGNGDAGLFSLNLLVKFY